MSRRAAVIRLRGVRHNNLKTFDLDLPLRQLIVVTGVSGSGKSSLAFDTLYAEGQRRYIETFSPYARQFFDRMDKPQVDKIEGIPPAIAIEQRNSVKTTRSTVGTMTELCDYMKLLWPHLAQLYCRQCRQPVCKDSPQAVWGFVRESAQTQGAEVGEALVTFDLPLSEKIPLAESLGLISKQGYQRILLRADPIEVLRLDEVLQRLQANPPKILTVVQDRLKLGDTSRARFVEACEQAYHFGKGKLAVLFIGSGQTRCFSNRLHCAQCDLEYREPTPPLFSFNNPVGACPACRGFGRTITIDYNLAIPDRSKTLAEGAIKPWQTGHGVECQNDLLRMCRTEGIRADVPFARLPRREQDLIINGDPDYGTDVDHEWPRAWYGVKGYFRWLESKAYKMHVRVLLSRYRAYSPCRECQGKRLKPDALLYRVKVPSHLSESDVAAGILTTAESCAPARGTPSANVPIWKTRSANPGSGMLPMTASETSETPAAAMGKATIELSLADFYSLTVDQALALIDHLTAARFCAPGDPIALVLGEVTSRLRYLADVGLGYLTLDRPTRTLSGGETERVNLTTCLGTRLVNTLFVLDEPSVGLHTRDTARLVRILESLRDAGNTVIVVEHEASVIRAADQIVDLGPGSGEAGGHVIFQGPFKRILPCCKSLTGQYLSGRKQIELPTRRPIKPGQAPSLPGSSARTGWQSESLALHDAPVPLLGRRDVCPTLKITSAVRHNLKNLSIEIPLNRFVAVTGVSGSGKTTLVREVLHPLLEAKLREAAGRSVSADDEAEEELRPEAASTSAQLYGSDALRDVVLVDQSPLGRTPRSNPAVYVGAFDDIRELFARTELARQRGLSPSAFSFNSTQGQCETCRGAGFEKIEMQFLSDVYIRCPACGGRRYRPHILEVKVSCPLSVISGKRGGQIKTAHRRLSTAEKIWSIADLLEATVDEAIAFLDAFSDAPPARRAVMSLRLLQEVGLGYLRLGQPINTLSGGESQRLKLVRHLAEFAQSTHTSSQPTLFLFDEPTTGLHFDDVRVLLKVFQRLVDGGHSLIVIEHNLDVIKCADWILDLGPEAGDQGGRIVAQGTPEEIAACEESHTGRALRELLGFTNSRILRRPPTAEYATYA